MLLPIELVYMIYDYIEDDIDRCKFRLMNRRWHSQICNCPWRRPSNYKCDATIHFCIHSKYAKPLYGHLHWYHECIATKHREYIIHDGLKVYRDGYTHNGWQIPYP